MIFLLFLIQSIQAQTYFLQIDRENIIDKFDKFGEIFQQELIYEKDSSKPCHFTKQRLIQKEQTDLNIIEEFNENYFQQNYNEGHLNGKVDEILAAVQIESGSIVLTKQGKLIHVKINENITMGEEIEINFQTNNKLFMNYLTKSRILLLIGHEETLALQFGNDADIFKNYVQLKIYDKFNINSIKSIATVNDMIFMAMGEAGIQMYQFKEKTFQSVPWVINGNIINSFANAVDVKVFSNSLDQIYTIFVLDKVLGIQQFVYNQITTLISQNTKFNKIPQIGDMFDIHKSILMIVEHFNSYSLVYEYKLNLTEYSFEFINSHKTFRDVQDIDILSNYVIILGKGGHQIFKHSIPKLNNTSMNNQVVIPNLKQLYYRDQKSETEIFGYTTHKYFYSKIKEAPSALYCYSNSTLEGIITFQYKQKSTKCPESIQNQGEFCEIQKTYKIFFVQPRQGANRADLILIYGVSGVLGLGFILLIILLIKQYRAFNSLPQEYYEWQSDDPSQRSPQSSSLEMKQMKEDKFSQIKREKIPDSIEHDE